MEWRLFCNLFMERPSYFHLINATAKQASSFSGTHLDVGN